MSKLTRASALLKFIQSLRIRSRDLQIVPLKLNYAQRTIWSAIEDRINKQEKVWVIALKARREGVSTLFEALMLARTILTPRVHSLVMASNAGNTAEIWQMASTMINNSPFRKYADPKNKELHIGESKLIIATAGSADAMRGFDLTCLHLSEVAFWENPNTMNAVMQCLPDTLDTFCFIESTANGKVGHGEQFYDMWCRATTGESEFIPIFLPWFAMPEYCRPHYLYKDQWTPARKGYSVLDDPDPEEQELRREFQLTAGQLAWRRWAVPNKCEGSLDKFNQEYPATPDGAFIASGLPMFRSADLIPFQKDIRRGERFTLEGSRWKFDPQGYIEVWKHPEPGHTYVIGADTSMGYDDNTGRSQRSRSSACVIDMATLEQCAEYDASTPPHMQARHLAHMGTRYNNALLAPEVTSSGGGGGRELIVYLKELNYWNIHVWRHADRIRREQGSIYGWECVHPDSRILMKDLTWKPAHAVLIGDRVLGYKESGLGLGQGRTNTLRWQTVTETRTFIAPRVEVLLENGQRTCVSENHPLWVSRPTKRLWRFREAASLRPGDYVRAMQTWDTERTYEAGRLSGLLDGEGHLSQGKRYGLQLLISQVVGPLADEIEELWQLMKFETYFKHLRHRQRPWEQVLTTCGPIKIADVLRALGSLRPTRLLRKFDTLDLERLTVKGFPRVRVRSVRQVDDGPVIGLTTDPDHTLIADGILGHNTNSRTRPMMIARIREVITERTTTIHSAGLLKQLANFGENEAGRTEALSGHDDLLFAFGIALCSRRENYFAPSNVVPITQNKFDSSSFGFPMHAYAANEAVARHWQMLQKKKPSVDNKNWQEL